ncbi:MAG TPA: lipopolysaccharide heptosyltransferase II [Terriglobia bacterium]|nr:lipopolysaccharide heptosyltransferase II [Terriglobia bacterium]
MTVSTRFANVQRILVRSTNWVGDAVMSIPALEALRARFARAEIVLLSKPSVSELYWHMPAVNRQIIYKPHSEHRGPLGFAKLIRELRAERFDAALLFPNSFHSAYMAWRAGIPLRIGYARDGRSFMLHDAIEPPPPAAYGHQVYYYLQLLFRAGLIAKPSPVHEIRLRLTEAEGIWAAKKLAALGMDGPRFLVGFAPGAAFGPAKRWMPERFAGLADRLIGALNADVLIFGTAAERPLAEEIAAAMKHTPVIAAGETSLRQLLALMTQCKLMVTNDSGPMHLAGALGIPLVAIFGSTDARATGPVGTRVRIVHRGVECSPCGRRVCPIDFRCMREIPVEEVFRATLELVKRWNLTIESSL